MSSIFLVQNRAMWLSTFLPDRESHTKAYLVKKLISVFSVKENIFMSEGFFSVQLYPSANKQPTCEEETHIENPVPYIFKNR